LAARDAQRELRALREVGRSVHGKARELGHAAASVTFSTLGALGWTVSPAPVSSRVFADPCGAVRRIVLRRGLQ
jgi:hypothetical protein